MKLYKKILLLIPMTALAAGCNKFLDHAPDDRASLNDLESVKALLVSAYPNGHYLMQGELMSDNADDKGTWTLSLYPEMQEEAYFWKESSQTVQDAPEHYWQQLYKAIAAANHAIEAIEKNGGGPEYDPYLGEAKMVRAFTHFLLVNFWAKHYDPATAATDPGVPYVTLPEKEALVNYKRNTVKEVYDLIEKDMKEGLPLLSDNAYAVPKYHFNKAAANAFMARFYTFRGEEGDWDKVIAHTSAILVSNFKSQLRDYAGKYMPVSSNLDEYAKLYGNYAEPAILLIANAPSMWYYTSRWGRYGLSDVKLAEVLNAAWVKSDQSPSVKHEWIGASPGAYPNYIMNKYYGYIQLAYQGATSGIPYVISPMLTVEEVVFNRIEANVMKRNYGAAIADLNVYLSTRTKNYVSNTHDLGMEYVEIEEEDPVTGKVTTRKDWRFNLDLALSQVVGFYQARQATSVQLKPWYDAQLDETQRCMLQYITDLRRKEFLQEGMRWFDVKRFGIEVTHKIFRSSGQPEVLRRDDPRRVLQIPVLALEYGLEPNPR